MMGGELKAKKVLCLVVGMLRLFVLIKSICIWKVRIKLLG